MGARPSLPGSHFALLIPSATTVPPNPWPCPRQPPAEPVTDDPRRLHDRRNLLLFRVNGATTLVILPLPLHVFRIGSGMHDRYPARAPFCVTLALAMGLLASFTQPATSTDLLSFEGLGT